MYQSFYGLNDKPFSMLPDPAFLYLGKKHQTALTLLEYGLYNHAGFCVISGDTGAGKTTLLRQLLNNVDDTVVVGMITNTHQSFGTLLDWILSAFNIHQPNMDKVEMHQLFVDFLLEQYAKNKNTLLIVDEAQNLPAETLEELRMLSNVNSEKDQVLQVILAGQPALKDTLRRPELMQFAQRIAVDYHLEHLSLEETCGYIQHRLKTSGATKDIFTPNACVRIHSYSGGTPRLINLICDTVLVYGFADQNLIIDENLIDEMVAERMKDSVVPILDVARIDEIKNSEIEKIDFEFPSIIDEEKNVKEEEKATAAESEDQVEVNNIESVIPELIDKVIEPVSELEQKMHVLESEIHELEEEVQVLEGKSHDKDLSVYQDVPDRRRSGDLVNNKYVFAIMFLLLAGLFYMTWDKEAGAPKEVASDTQSIELKKMLDEVEKTKQELERMKSKEAERLVEIATIKSAEINRKTAETLGKAKEEEMRSQKKKPRRCKSLRWRVKKRSEQKKELMICSSSEKSKSRKGMMSSW